MATKMQQRRGTSAQWAAANVVLAAGEIGWTTDSRMMKIGDGATAWNSLPFANNPFGVYAPPATGVAATDTANLLAAIAETISLFGPDGGPVYLRPTNATTWYKINATLTLPKAGWLIGAGAGGRSLDGGFGNPDRVCTKLDATAITDGAAIDLGTAGTSQRVAGMYLLGPAPNTSVASKAGGSVGIDGGYFALLTYISDLYIYGFSNQIVLQNSMYPVIERVHGKQSGVHGLYAYADAPGSSEGLSVKDCLFADAGLTSGLVTATHRPGAIMLEHMRGVRIDVPSIDECFNGSASIGIIGTSDDITIEAAIIYAGNAAGNVGVQIGDGTNVVKHVTVRDARIKPYNTSSPGSKGIVIATNVYSTVLNNIKLTNFGSLADYIEDNGYMTVFDNVNQGFTKAVQIYGPSAYWRMGEGAGIVAKDEIGSSHGKYVGSPTLTTPSAVGDGNKAATFNGTSQYIAIPDNDYLDFGDAFSIIAWIKRTGTSGGAVHTIVSKGAGGYMLQIQGSDKLYLEKEDLQAIVESTTTIVDTNWHFVAATKDGATVKLYIDAVDVTGTVSNATIVNTTDPLNIGRRVSHGNAWWPGSLDEIALYPRALSAAEITAIYALRSGF